MQQAVAAGQGELGADVGAVRLDRARADEKFRGDLAAGFLLGDELEDAAFGLGEVVQAGLFGDERFGPATATDEITGNRRA